jgi:hypothetical protein
MRRKLNLVLWDSYPINMTLTSIYRITAHPDLQFLLVINPHNGPGISPLADPNYIREVARLNSISNVCTIGYVRVDYCKRDLAKVYRDIEIFAEWAKDYARTGLGVHGIFIDEAPNEHSEYVGRYLDGVGLKVKGIEGIMGDQLVSKFTLDHSTSMLTCSIRSSTTQVQRSMPS